MRRVSIVLLSCGLLAACAFRQHSTAGAAACSDEQCVAKITEPPAIHSELELALCPLSLC